MASSVIVGAHHSCATFKVLEEPVLQDPTTDNVQDPKLPSSNLVCWGKNTNGQLGIGSTISDGASASQIGDRFETVALLQGIPFTILILYYRHRMNRM